MLCSAPAYKFKCGGWNTTYHGETKCHFKDQICEHLGISHHTDKEVKIDKNKLSTIQEYL